jgi:hypothetical protein
LIVNAVRDTEPIERSWAVFEELGSAPAVVAAPAELPIPSSTTRRFSSLRFRSS